MRNYGVLLHVCLALAVPGLAVGQDGDAAARKRARLRDDAAGFWIYDDLQAGYAAAKASAKPLLVSFRCVP